jgi:hypothetical protein
MKQKQLKKKEREEARLFSEEIAECKQMLFMKCVFFAIVSEKSSKFYSDRRDDLQSDTDAEKRVKIFYFGASTN